MSLIPITLLFLIFISLALLHIYWAFGGKWAFEKALPQDENGTLVLKPKAFECIMVSVILFVICLYLLIKMQLIVLPLPLWLLHCGTKILATIFFLRAVGDFKYVGFFKKIKNTVFSGLDTSFYSPLCLIIAFLLIFV